MFVFYRHFNCLENSIKLNYSSLKNVLLFYIIRWLYRNQIGFFLVII